MNNLQSQVRLARRRMRIQRFLACVPWTLSATFVIAALAILLTKVIPLGVDGQAWSMAWAGGAAIAGVTLAGAIAWFKSAGSMDAAIEIDQRCGLKERVSSCLSLTPEEQQTDAGRALTQDAIRRVSNVNVNEHFGVRINRWALLPGAAAVVTFGLTLLSDAQPDPNSSVQAATGNVEKRVLNSTESLKKKLEERRKTAMEKGLKDAEDLFKRLEQGVDSLGKKENVDHQKALVKLNDLARDLQERQQRLLNKDALRQQLNSLKDIKQGPADRMAKAMKKGDFKTALDELKQLQNQLRKGELTKEQSQQLQQQLAEMKEKMEQMSQMHQQAQQDLKRQIEQKLAQGDRKAAGDLQKKLDELQQRNEQMAQLNQLGQKLGECAQSMKAGQMQNASDALGQLADQLEGMQQELAEMEMLEDALDQLASAKDAMSCQSCNGMGCSMCQGDMMGMSGLGNGMGMGMGLGQGQGRGDRPEEETGTGFYDSQVRSRPGRGKAVATGIAFGPNKSGQALEEIKAEIDAGRRAHDDPLTGHRLPKPQRDLTREYFDSFREGE